MTTGINLVQGFQGIKSYILNFDGNYVDVSNAVVTFNFVDRYEKNKHSIKCKRGKESSEVLIPFTEKDTSDFGDFYGEFVVKTLNNIEIFPILDYIPIIIRKRVEL